MSEDYEAPLYVAGEPRSESDFLIYTTYHAESDPPFAKVEDILRRHGIDASAGYARHGVLVGATLNADQLAAIRRDRQVEYAERDCVDHVARYFRHRAGDRIDGSYIVSGVKGTDTHALVARHDISAATMLEILDGFGAQLSDEQRDRLRHEPDVKHVSDDCIVDLAANSTAEP
jgi:hypothetical protein